MFVSDIHQRDQAPGDREQALRWLQGALAWEHALDRLRRRAGIPPALASASALESKSAA